MKNHWKILYKLNSIHIGNIIRVVCLTTLIGTLSITNVNAADNHDSLDDMDFIEMINSVETGKQSDLIQQFQQLEAKNRLLNGKYSPKGECIVESYRNKEVLLITIPAHLLFAPNSTDLKHGADDYLSPIKRYLKDPDMYRVLLVMHTDNTGSEQYREQITTDRVNAVAEWFDESGVNTDYLFSYAMSDDIPLVSNNSMDNRDKNRRLEIYLMPGTKMVEQAKKGRISF
ncbi:MAG: OmpA family protein [Muribaculaceae bacterium]|nr:OmpA family protein [Muribaculaceae bacterium]